MISEITKKMFLIPRREKTLAVKTTNRFWVIANVAGIESMAKIKSLAVIVIIVKPNIVIAVFPLIFTKLLCP